MLSGAAYAAAARSDLGSRASRWNVHVGRAGARGTEQSMALVGTGKRRNRPASAAACLGVLLRPRSAAQRRRAARTAQGGDALLAPEWDWTLGPRCPRRCSASSHVRSIGRAARFRFLIRSFGCRWAQSSSAWKAAVKRGTLVTTAARPGEPERTSHRPRSGAAFPRASLDRPAYADGRCCTPRRAPCSRRQPCIGSAGTHDRSSAHRRRSGRVLCRSVRG